MAPPAPTEPPSDEETPFASWDEFGRPLSDESNPALASGFSQGTHEHNLTAHNTTLGTEYLTPLQPFDENGVATNGAWKSVLDNWRAEADVLANTGFVIKLLEKPMYGMNKLPLEALMYAVENHADLGPIPEGCKYVARPIELPEIQPPTPIDVSDDVVTMEAITP
ncbi:hypothetical protein AB1Y20_018409 [Prymnesium parvum]|uniref:Uncharacterized protein n=1 Tax=Prymnesium parvum TaxID=97485 RepID=A0AB34JRW8_PRYPA